MKTHASYWAILRDSDGFECAIASTRRELSGLIDKQGNAQHIAIAGFVPIGETASLVKVTQRVACNWECDGINEDDAVYYGVCDVCGLPLVD